MLKPKAPRAVVKEDSNVLDPNFACHFISPNACPSALLLIIGYLPTHVALLRLGSKAKNNLRRITPETERVWRMYSLTSFIFSWLEISGICSIEVLFYTIYFCYFHRDTIFIPFPRTLLYKCSLNRDFDLVLLSLPKRTLPT